MLSGSLTVAVPAGWTPPATSAGPGYTTSSVGALSVSGQTITVTGVTRTVGQTVIITYGSGAPRRTGDARRAGVAVQESSTRPVCPARSLPLAVDHRLRGRRVGHPHRGARATSPLRRPETRSSSPTWRRPAARATARDARRPGRLERTFARRRNRATRPRPPAPSRPRPRRSRSRISRSQEALPRRSHTARRRAAAPGRRRRRQPARRPGRGRSARPPRAFSRTSAPVPSITVNAANGSGTLTVLPRTRATARQGTHSPSPTPPPPAAWRTAT